MILGLDDQLSSHAGRNLKIRLNLKNEENYKYRIYYTLKSKFFFYKKNIIYTYIYILFILLQYIYFLIF